MKNKRPPVLRVIYSPNMDEEPIDALKGKLASKREAKIDSLHLVARIYKKLGSSAAVSGFFDKSPLGEPLKATFGCFVKPSCPARFVTDK